MTIAPHPSPLSSSGPARHRLHSAVTHVLTPEMLTFLTVGGAGYVVDVVAFNLLRGPGGLAGLDPAVARVGAVGLAMVVTYLGNRLLTWRGRSRADRRREIGLFLVFNAVGLAISVLALVVSRDVLGLTSRLADNVSANVVGTALGTAFRFWSYQRFVFVDDPTPPDPDQARGAVRLMSGGRT